MLIHIRCNPIVAIDEHHQFTSCDCHSCISGIRQAAIAEERRRLQPFINRQVREAAAVAARNAREILGEDPAEEAAILEAASVQAARVRAYDAPSASDLLGAPQPSGGEDIRDEDLF